MNDETSRAQLRAQMKALQEENMRWLAKQHGTWPQLYSASPVATASAGCGTGAKIELPSHEPAPFKVGDEIGFKGDKNPCWVVERVEYSHTFGWYFYARGQAGMLPCHEYEVISPAAIWFPIPQSDPGDETPPSAPDPKAERAKLRIDAGLDCPTIVTPEDSAAMARAFR